MTVAKKTLCLLVAACLFSTGCQIRLGYRTNLLRTEQERRPISSAGTIEGHVAEALGGLAVLRLSRMQKEEVTTVELYQRVQRRYDLTGLVLATGGTAFLLFIILMVAAINSDGSSSGSSSSWDWD